jgi:hypothetical protein
MMRARTLLLTLACALSGCGGERTEIRVIIDKSGIVVGQDIDALHITVAPDETSKAFYDLPVPLCTQALTTNCHQLPLHITLIPGATGLMNMDNVRLQVDAKIGGDSGTVRISDVANFTFSKGESLLLELVLSSNCLGNLSCAQAGLACGPMGCYKATPEPDNADLSAAVDLAPPADLRGADFAGVDFSCAPKCAANYCGSDSCGGACTCAQFQECDPSSNCVPCGIHGQACCPTSQSPRCQQASDACSSTTGSGTCVACLPTGNACSNGGAPCCSGSFCNGTTCQACGGATQPCCPGSPPTCSAANACVGGTTCAPCGMQDQVCCSGGSACQSGLTCIGGAPPTGPGSDHCTPCGNTGDPCCSGACNLTTTPPITCYQGNCAQCGQMASQPCCNGDSCVTGTGIDCNLGSGLCEACGQNQNDACCTDGSCYNGLKCTGPGGSCQPPSGDMAMSMDMDASFPCGNYMQMCCSGGGGPPCNDMPYLTCDTGTCNCGYMGGPCCDPGLMTQCQGGLVCNNAGGTVVPGTCMPMNADMGSCMAMQGQPCCGPPTWCAPTFTCCMPGPMCSGINGIVPAGQCYK